MDGTGRPRGTRNATPKVEEGIMQNIVATASYLRKLSLDTWRLFMEITGPAHQGNRCGRSPEAHAGEGFMIT